MKLVLLFALLIVSMMAGIGDTTCFGLCSGQDQEDDHIPQPGTGPSHPRAPSTHAAANVASSSRAGQTALRGYSTTAGKAPQETMETEIPWLADVGSMHNKVFKRVCGAALIDLGLESGDSNLLLTSAMCANKVKGDITIRFHGDNYYRVAEPLFHHVTNSLLENVDNIVLLKIRGTHQISDTLKRLRLDTNGISGNVVGYVAWRDEGKMMYNEQAKGEPKSASAVFHIEVHTKANKDGMLGSPFYIPYGNAPVLKGLCTLTSQTNFVNVGEDKYKTWLASKVNEYAAEVSQAASTSATAE